MSRLLDLLTASFTAFSSRFPLSGIPALSPDSVTFAGVEVVNGIVAYFRWERGQPILPPRCETNPNSHR